MSINEHKLYRRSFFDKISKHKGAIFFITLFFISLTYLYLLFAQKVYRTDATLEIISKSNLLGSQANLNEKQSFKRYIVTQMDLLRSRYLISKAIDALDANIEYFQKQKLGAFSKTLEDIPFIIKDLKIKDKSFYNKMFHIEAIDSERYALRLVPKNSFISDLFQEKKGKPLIYKFSQPVFTKYMNFTIMKNPASSQKEIYFNVLSKHAYIDKVLKNLNVNTTSSDSSMIRVMYDDNSPLSAQYFVNELLKEYKEIISNNRVSQTREDLELLGRELVTAKKKLDESEKKLQNYVKQNRVAGIDAQTNRMIDTIYKYNNELESLDIEYQNINKILNTYKRTEDYREILTQVSQLDNANLSKLVDSIAKDVHEYKKLRQKYKIKHPKVQALQKSIAQKESVLKINLEQIHKSVKDKRGKILKYLSTYKNKLMKIPQKEIGYAKLKREHDLLEKSYLLLFDKKMQITISKKIQGEYDYKVLDEAILPHSPIKPKKGILLALGTILGLVAGIMFALLSEYFAKKITVPGDVEELTDFPYLGTIPYITDKKLYNDLFVIKEPKSLASQMMWALRDKVDAFKSGEKSQIIAITSMIKGEGKTTVSANLALCLGMGDKKSVIVSLDLRLPEIHKKFDIDNSKGISDVLFGDKNIFDVTYRCDQYKNLYIIPSGSLTDNPMKIINSNYIDEVVELLRDKYDYIIFDLPPVSVAAESVFLMKKADLVIDVLKANYSEKSFVTYIQEVVSNNKIKHLGFVLNAVDKKYIKILSRKENQKYIKQHKLTMQKS